MELDPTYTFVPLVPNRYVGINNKDVQGYLKKWGIQDNISIQNFSFNEEYQPYNKYQIVEKFFKNDVVAHSLLLKEGNSWINKSIKAASIEINNVPCTIQNLSFFDKIRDPKNKIISNSGNIRQRYETLVDDYYVSDHLKGMLLDEECQQYNLYTDQERQEFIFRIFQMLVIGGSLCQYEDQVEPYIDVTKNIYKDLIRVHIREDSSDLSIGSTVLEVVAKNSQGEAFFPSNPEIRQNIGFLLIDGSNRQITTFLHQLGSFHW